MTDWNDNRTQKRRKPASVMPQMSKQRPGVVMNNTSAEPVTIVQDEPVIVDILRGHAMPVSVDNLPGNAAKAVTWLVALAIAVLGSFVLVFIPSLAGAGTVTHQIFGALILLTIVIAVKY